MKLKTGIRKEKLMEMIKKNKNSDENKRKLLNYLLNIDSSFLHFSFGLGDETSVNMDYIYTEMKTYFIPALLTSNWTFGFGETFLEENVFIVCIRFNQTKNINEFIFSGTFEKDNRKKFNQLEIYLTKNEKKTALEQGVIKSLQLG